MNGSFENNGHSISDITDEAPLNWCDVSVTGEYYGWVNTGWSTHPDTTGDSNSVAVASNPGESFTKGDSIRLSQQVLLETDAGQLSFDLKLLEGSGYGWDPQRHSAIVMIDENVIWDSNELELDSNGEFEGTVVVDVNHFEQFLDDDWHELTLAMKTNSNFSTAKRYQAHWDFVKFDKYCGGLGFLLGDLNQDCYVTLDDFAEFATSWMDEPASPKGDLYDDGFVDYNDLMLFAEDWLYNTDWTKWGQERTFEIERLENDFDLSGQIDLGDIMVLSDYWLLDGSGCGGPELSGDNIVNFRDFAVLANQWRLRYWLYYAE
jgi:hypothetical protein